MKKRILVICTGNSCRSQMAEGFLKSFGDDIDVYSAGTSPTSYVHPRAVAVMKEIGIDISRNKSKHVFQFLSQPFDYVITVCDNAKENCPVFTGDVIHRMHMGFEDPSWAMGSEEEMLSAFREVRDKIGTAFREFYSKEIERLKR